MFWRALTVLFALSISATALADISLRSDLALGHDVQPGQLVEGSITVENVGPGPATVRIYQRDYSFQSDGTTEYGEPGSSPRSNAGWMELEHSIVTIPPDSWEEVDYRISVPFGDLEGSYWSMVMIEEVETDTQQAAEGVAVQTVMRYGVQIVTEIPGTGQSALEFTSPTLVDEQGDYTLQVDVVNSGQRMIRAHYHVELYDEAGTRVIRVEGDRKRTYPGTSVRQRFQLGQLVPGDYTALVIADSGEEDLFGAQYQLNISGP